MNYRFRKKTTLIFYFFTNLINAKSYPIINYIPPTCSQNDKIAITQSNISSGNSYTINKAGSYYLTSNLAFTPNSNNSPIILINTSNVVLDLSGKSIYSNKTYADITAIYINPNCSNVHIFNGGINAIAGIGINVNHDCSNIHLSNLSIQDCDNNGILIMNSNNIQVNNCSINNCKGSTPTNIGNALSVLNSGHIYAINCIFSNNSNPNQIVIGVFLSNCTSCYFESCFASHNSGSAAYGFKLENGCNDCTFSNCDAASQVALNNNSIGFDLSSSSANYFENCSANNNSSNNGSSYGFKTDCLSLANNFDHCDAILNSGDQDTGGFILQGNGNYLENCRANQNNGNNGNSSGFYLDGSADLNTAVGNILINCSANQNTSQNGHACGFLLKNSASNRLSNCLALNNTTAAQNKHATGFNATNGIGNSFENCTANNQYCSHLIGGTDYNKITHFAAGFLFWNNESDTIISNCHANSNNGGNGKGFGFGIYLQGSGLIGLPSTSISPTNTIVRNCFLKFNTSNNGYKYGFLDENPKSSTVLVNNLATGQGTCFNNRNILSMNYLFYHPNPDQNPANIIHETDNFNWTTLSTSIANWMNISIITS